MIILKRLLQDKGAVIALGIIVLYVFLGLAAPLVTFYDPNHIDTANKFAGMSFQHLLGTDHLGFFLGFCTYWIYFRILIRIFPRVC